MDTLNTVGKRLAWARELRGLTQKELAAAVGAAQATLSMVERGERATSRHIVKLAHVLKVDPLWLAEGRGEPEPAATPGFSNVEAAERGMRRYPVISYVQAGTLTEIKQISPDFGIGVEYGDDDASRNAFFLIVEGDSMIPLFQAGDRVRIDPEVVPNPGDFVVACNERNEATFKKYRLRGIDASGNEIFELVPLNSDYATLRSNETRLNILGTMTEHRRKYRRTK